MGKLHFACDYQEGAYPSILKRLEETNYDHTPGYGADEITASAKERIRNACDAPLAEVEFLVGGTQTNAVVIDSLLKSYQGVITADTGHISVHEAGALRFCLRERRQPGSHGDAGHDLSLAADGTGNAVFP